MTPMTREEACTILTNTLKALSNEPLYPTVNRDLLVKVLTAALDALRAPSNSSPTFDLSPRSEISRLIALI